MGGGLNTKEIEQDKKRKKTKNSQIKKTGEPGQKKKKRPSLAHQHISHEQGRKKEKEYTKP